MNSDEEKPDPVFSRPLGRLEGWAEESTVVAVCLSERVQVGVVTVVVLASVAGVARSDMSVVAEFLSFLTLFVVLAVLTWSLTDPLAE